MKTVTQITICNYPVTTQYIQNICEEFNLKCTFIKEKSSFDTQIYNIYGKQKFKKEFKMFIEEKMEEFYKKNKI